MFPAIEEHYIKNRQRLLKKLTFRAGSPEAGEDVLQEAYLRAIKYWRSYNGEGIDRWFSTIVNNALREYKNAEKGHILDEFDEEEADGTACTIYSDQVVAQIYDRIYRKSPDQREVLILYFQYEYSAKDISEITDFSYAKAHQIIQRFRNELKELFK